MDAMFTTLIAIYDLNNENISNNSSELLAKGMMIKDRILVKYSANTLIKEHTTIRKISLIFSFFLYTVLKKRTPSKYVLLGSTRCAGTS